jgi:hypothetical protein
MVYPAEFFWVLIVVAGNISFAVFLTSIMAAIYHDAPLRDSGQVLKCRTNFGRTEKQPFSRPSDAGKK